MIPVPEWSAAGLTAAVSGHIVAESILRSWSCIDPKGHARALDAKLDFCELLATCIYGGSSPSLMPRRLNHHRTLRVASVLAAWPIILADTERSIIPLLLSTGLGRGHFSTLAPNRQQSITSAPPTPISAPMEPCPTPRYDERGMDRTVGLRCVCRRTKPWGRKYR